MSWTKIIFANIFITFSLLGMLLLAPPIAYSLYSLLVESQTENSSQDARANLDLYRAIEWAPTHFNEFSNLNTIYLDYITWRRDDFDGETINIANGLRATYEPTNLNSNADEYLFFGGSTTWGTGVNDENTYPSIFAVRSSTSVTNFGESGYIARQSLARLANYFLENKLSDLSGQHIVFYDGVNDVAVRCRSEITGLGTVREQQIQSILAPDGTKRSERYSFATLFEQLTQVLQAVTRRLGTVDESTSASEIYACTSDPRRAEEVAKTLVAIWQIASDLVTQRGGKFTAILQPVAYLGSANVGYLELTSPSDAALSMQYETVYPLIRQFAAATNIDFVDLSSVYDNCNNCYIDFCHVGPQAHQILVDKLVNSVN